MAARATLAAWEVLSLRGPVATGIALCDRVPTLDLGRARAEVLEARSALLGIGGEPRRAEADLTEALALAGDPAAEARLRCRLAELWREGGRVDDPGPRRAHRHAAGAEPARGPEPGAGTHRRGPRVPVGGPRPGPGAGGRAGQRRRPGQPRDRVQRPGRPRPGPADVRGGPHLPGGVGEALDLPVLRGAAELGLATLHRRAGDAEAAATHLEAAAAWLDGVDDPVEVARLRIEQAVQGPADAVPAQKRAVLALVCGSIPIALEAAWAELP